MATKSYNHGAGRRANTEMPDRGDQDAYDINKLKDDNKGGDDNIDLQNYKGIYANDENSQKY